MFSFSQALVSRAWRVSRLHGFLYSPSRSSAKTWCPVHVFVSRDDVFLTKTWDPDTKEFENLVSVILGLPCHLCLLSFIKVKKEGICEVLAHMFLYGF